MKCKEYWLNINQWAVMDVFSSLSTRANWKEIDWEIYYLLSTGKLVIELPIISTKKDTFQRIIKVLKDKWLIEYKDFQNQSYYKLSEKWKQFTFEGQDLNPRGLGFKSWGGQDLNPNYNNTSNNKTKIIINKPDPFLNIIWPYKTALEEFEEHRKEIKSPMSIKAKEKLLKTLNPYPLETKIKMIDQAILNGRKWVFPIKEAHQKPIWQIEWQKYKNQNRNSSWMVNRLLNM